MATDISPGLGVRGIDTARRLFVERARMAAITAVGLEDKIRVSTDGSSGAPFLIVAFDYQSILTMRFWSHHRIDGWEPWFVLETSRHFTWHTAADRQSRPARWDSEAETIIKAVQQFATTITFVETP